MTQVKSGDTVRIHYTGTLLDGSTFDSSDGRDPLEFEVGSGHVIAGLDVALPGMAVGDKKTVNVPCDQAYGPIDPDMSQIIARGSIPPEIELQVGLRLQMQAPDGQALPVVVSALTEDEVTLDANHPLAGLDLIFAIEVVSVG